jgi:hypothetical protein
MPKIDKTATLASEARMSRTATTPTPSLSPVLQRYYGFMIGFMSTLLRLPFVRSRFEPHRRRLADVMVELDIKWTPPTTPWAYRADTDLERHLALELKLLGKTAVDFFTLGQSALQALVDCHSARGRVALRAMGDIVAEHALNKDLVLSRVASGWDDGQRGYRLIAGLMSRAYDLVAISMLNVGKEQSTCFVIMPFAPPFRDAYNVF